MTLARRSNEMAFAVTMLLFPIILTLVAVACSGKVSELEIARELPGVYELRIGSNQTAPDRGVDPGNLVSERLVLHKDGSLEQRCVFKVGDLFERKDATWRYDGGVHFSSLKDCSGFLGMGGAEIAASLVLERHGVPQILLHPDRNVFYERVSVE